MAEIYKLINVEREDK